MSIHNEASFQKAKRQGGSAAYSRKRWEFLTVELSKRELAEIICHLAALATGEYDAAISDDRILLGRISEEINVLRLNRIL